MRLHPLMHSGGSNLLHRAQLATRSIVMGVIFGSVGLGGAACGEFAHLEGRQTHPLGLTPDGRLLLAVNTPDARLSVFDVSNASNPAPVLIAEIPVGLEPVSLRARTDDEVWVVNEVSDSVSIVSLARGMVVATLPCPDEPADVVFAQGKAFVSCARSNLLRVFDEVTRTELGTIALDGLYPRALAVDGSGTEVYAAFQLSGNQSTILSAALAPAQPEPSSTNLPAPPQTALIVPAGDPRIVFTVLDHDVAVISAGEQRVLEYLSGAGTSLFDLAQRPGAQELWVANTEARNLVRFEPNLKGHFADNRLTRFRMSAGTTDSFDLMPGVDYTLLPNPAALATALAQPTAIVFSADGSNAWIAAFGSDRVAKLNAADGTVTARIDVRTPPEDGSTNDSRRMRGPRGLALHEGHERLYVLNKLANSISVIDTGTDQVMAEVTTGSFDPTPVAVKEGRGFLFDARLSGNGTASCATCHLDADRDGLAWDLGDPNGEMTTVIGANLASHDTRPQTRNMHPMKGPMMTQTLRGLATNQLLHWRGDRPTLRHFNPTFRDLMGGSLLTDAEMDLLKQYLDTLRHHPNPNLNPDNTLPATFDGADPTRGHALFTAHINHCGVCHTLPGGSDNNVDDLRNVGGAQSMKTPPLQTVYQRAHFDSRSGSVNFSGFGLLHDGTGGNRSLPTVHFYELDELVGSDFADVRAFLMCFDTGTAPVVGMSRTVTLRNRDDAGLIGELALLEFQSPGSHACDLVVQGRLTGDLRRFTYDPPTLRYRGDSQRLPLLTREQLFDRLTEGDALTFTGVLPGDGPRQGFDRNRNGIPDAEEPKPSLNVFSRAGRLRVSWPEESADWLPERAPAVSGPWRPDLSLRSREGGSLNIDHPLSEEPLEFFRLRRVW